MKWLLCLIFGCDYSHPIYESTWTCNRCRKHKYGKTKLNRGNEINDDEHGNYC